MSTCPVYTLQQRVVLGAREHQPSSLDASLACPPGATQRGLTPQRSCPPVDASCVWQWPHPPPAHTAASLSQTPSGGPHPGAQGAAPLVAGPSPGKEKKGVSSDSTGPEGQDLLGAPLALSGLALSKHSWALTHRGEWSHWYLGMALPPGFHSPSWESSARQADRNLAGTRDGVREAPLRC